jgi:hypothetical protein
MGVSGGRNARQDGERDLCRFLSSLTTFAS